MENIYIKKSNPRTVAEVLGGRSPNTREYKARHAQSQYLSTVCKVNKMLLNEAVVIY